MALLALTTAASFTPGPNTTLSTALAANYGLKRAMTFVCAVPVGWGLLFQLCVQAVLVLWWSLFLRCVWLSKCWAWAICCGWLTKSVWLAS